MANGTLKVSNIETSSGSGTITIGQSGETVTIPSGCTITNSGTASGFGGITEADGYRLTANLASDTDPISSNIERIDDDTFSKIGTGVTNTSGTFSFPSTGLYLVQAQAVVSRDNTNDNLIDFNIKTTPNNSTYTTRAVIRQSVTTAPTTQTGFTQTFVNVTDTSNVKVRFSFSNSDSNALIGDTDSTRTGWWFIRLGDSQ